MLIINADDWGYDARVTDAILRCFRAGAITSTTAMMFMEDSTRAAELATPWRNAIGLHLNLTEAYSDLAATSAVRDRQLRAIRVFEGARYRRWIYDPTVQRIVDDAIADQVEAYVELYGQAPSHFDGHHHIHTCPNVFLSRRFSRIARARHVIWHKGSPLARPIREARGVLLRRRFRTPRAFFDLRAVHPAFEGQGLDDVLRRAHREPVELMVHPGFPDELPVLLSNEWRALLQAVPLSSFRALKAPA
jgi:chitin disaccharide deacetylase